MENEVREFPVAWCETCQDHGPVIVETLPMDGDDISEEMKEFGVTVVYCPQCEQILNNSGNIEVKWYTAEDLEIVTGWKITGEYNAK